MNEVEHEAAQDSAEKNKMDLLSINSIHLKKLLCTNSKLKKMSAGPYNIMVPYNVDMGSDGNIMPLHIYKKLFPKITNEQLAATKNKNILLKCMTKLQ